MKKLKLLSLLILFSYVLTAQLADQEYIFSEEEWAFTTSMVRVGNKTYVAGADHLCKNGVVNCVGQSVSLLFSTTIEGSGYWHVKDITYHEGNNFLYGCGYWKSADDYPTESDGPVVFGLGLSGGVFFTSHFDKFTYGDMWSQQGMELTYTNDNDIVVATAGNLLWLDQIGNIQNAQPVAVNSNFLGIKRVNDNHLLAYTLSDLYVMDHEGQILQTVAVANEIQSVFVDNDIAYCLTEAGLFVYDINNQSSEVTTDYLSSISSPKGICGNSSKLFIYEKSYSNPDKIIMLDKATYIVEDNYQFEQPLTSIAEVYTNDEKVFIAGNYLIRHENPNNSTNTFSVGTQSFIKTAAIFDEPLFSNNDLSMSNLEITNPLIPVDTIEDYPGDYHVIFDDPVVGFKFDITNNGTQAIHSFSVTSNSWWSFNCAESRYFVHFNNVNILPGETVTFSDDTWVINYMWLGSNLPQISLTAFAPNHQFDGNYSNNHVSQPAVLVDTDEPNFIKDISFSPNPTSNFIDIKAQLNETIDDIKINIFDTIGKQVRNETITGAHQKIEHKFFVGNLPHGMYIIQLLGSGKTYSEKIIVN